MLELLKIGIRPSKLAFKQVEEVVSSFPKMRFDTIMIPTQGDKDKVTSLSLFENTDFFTREIEYALLDEKIDVAIHSAKDMEGQGPDGLKVVATTRSISSQECLVARGKYALETLERESVVGTSSRNRRESIKRYRPDLQIKDLRGNVDERIAKLDRGEYDAIIVAHAALIRLGIQDRISQIISKKVIKPHPLQGKLAIQIRNNRDDLEYIFRSLDE